MPTSRTMNSDTELATLRVLVHDGQYDLLDLDSLGSGAMEVHSYCGSLAGYEWLLGQDESYVGIKGFHILSHLIFFDSTVFALNKSERMAAVLKRLVASQKFCGQHRSAEIDLLFMISLRPITDNLASPDLTDCVRVLWEASAKLLNPQDHGSTVGRILSLLVYMAKIHWNTEWRGPYDFLLFKLWGLIMERRGQYTESEIIGTLKKYPRLPRRLWATWYPSDDLPTLEVMQRCLDAQLEVLGEAGLLEAYGKEKELQYPGGHTFNSYGGRIEIMFEYGKHVHGCRIHLLGVCNADQQPTTNSTSTSSEMMPGSWVS